MSIGDELKCERCGHQWYARSAKRPVQCPRCKSPAWDRKPSQVGEAKAVYKAGAKEKSSKPAGPRVRRGKQEFDFSKLAAFGMWADRPETDEELLDLMKSGWGPPPGDE